MRNLSGIVALLALVGCVSAPPPASEARIASIQRTTHGVPHIQAPDFEAMAHGVAYAYAQDNICQAAQHLVTARGERAATFGASGSGLMGLRSLPNEQIDLFVAAQIDDARLAQAWADAGSDAHAMVRGYISGYNRYLNDHRSNLPAACAGQPWVRPMTLADFYRVTEITATQAGMTALADAILAAAPPAKTAALAPAAALDLADAAQAMREAGVLEPPFGSNAWAFGRAVTANNRGMLMGNPHFPWVGNNRFWQMHVTVPGQLDVMGAAIGFSPLVQIGFNKDVAWTHTVSTGKRFTLHELTLAPGEPTAYLIDGVAEKMKPQTVRIRSRGADGQISEKTHTVWRTRFGPVMVNPRAGLNWTTAQAYALQDSNAGNTRSLQTWLDIGRARSVQGVRAAMRNLGLPWVNTIAADRQGNAMYADVSAVPDVDAAHLARCAPSPAAARLLEAAGLVVLNGARSDCDWQRDNTSRVPGLTPIARMPIAIRKDWVHNSNDSFFYTHPQQVWQGISPLVGDDVVRRPRTRSEWIEIPDLVSRGPVTLAGMQRQLFENRNLMGRVVVPDLLAACAAAPSPEAREGCAVLRGWGRTSELNDPGAVLFREFWRSAVTIAGVHRQAFDRAQPVATPHGLAMNRPEVAAHIWAALGGAVTKMRDAGFAPNATLGQVQRPVLTDEPVFLHGGDEIEGVLNNLGDRGSPGIGPRGIRIDYGSSYIQTVTFDDRGPIAQALLTYGQSSHAGSPHQTDQMKLFASKTWPSLPFHPEDVANARVGDVLRLVLP